MTKNKKTRKEKNNKKQEIERERETESEKGKLKEAKEKERHWEMNKITRFQGKHCVLWKDQKTQKTKKGWRPTAPKHTCKFFLFLSLWSPHGYLSSLYTLFIAKMSLILFFTFGVLSFLFWWLCFVFCFHICLYCALCFWFCCFSFLHFSLCNQKTDEITKYLECSFWCSVLVPASSHFHVAQLRTPTQPREPPIKMVLNNVLKYLFLQCFLNINQHFPHNGP